MGFYPVNPVSGEYSIGSPLFDRVAIRLASGRTFEVRVHRKGSHGHRIKTMRLNGKAHRRYVLRHSDIMAGGVLDVYM